MADKFLDKTGLAYFWEKIKAYFQSQHTTPPEYTIVRLANEEVGYAASYVLKKDGTQVGATINIPKDYLVRSGEVKTVTVADEPYEGAVVGDKYLDFVVNTIDDSGNISHIYIPVSDLVDAYIAGNGIQISDNNYISVKVSQQGVDHGLGVGGDGLTVRMVTPSINGVGGTHGAMYAADKEKLDNLEIVGVFTTGSDTEPPVEGNDGLVPAPTWAERLNFLRGDATWANPAENSKELQNAVLDPSASGTSIEFISNISQNENGEITPLKRTVRTMVASGQNHASGLVPDPGSTAGTTRYLCENGTWSEPNGGGGGAISTPTDVQVNGTSITSNNVANIQTEGVYDPTTNKIATMSDLPNVPTVNDSTITIKKNSSDNGDSFTTNTVNNKTINLGLSDVATSGSYNDLEDVPAIPAAQIQSDWSQTNASSLDFIKNKPIIPTVPTNVSAFTNDAGYITTNDIPEGAAASTTTPKMDGEASIGTELAFARGDHRHPSDTSRVPTTRKVNNKPLSSDITLSASDVGALPSNTEIPTVGSLNTNNDTAQSTSSSESFGGTINLHKVSKTGNYNDLIGKPAIPDSTSDLTNDSGFITSSDIPSPADTSPLMDGTAAVGLSVDYAREDHVHPTDTSRAADNSVVHKTGNESISGAKTFNGGVMVGLGSQLKFETAQEEGAYIEAGDDNGVKTLMFADIEDDSAVRLENIANPSAGTDAANKAYVDSKGDNNMVKLNGRSGQYGVTPRSLCAFAISTSAILEIIEPFTTTGGINGKPVRQGVAFPIGCKIYYHPDYNDISANTDFTSKEFYSTYDEVDARYTAVTGQNISLYSSSQSGVYLRVTVNNGYWSPYYKPNSETEIIVTPHDFQNGNFYIYLGKTVGSTGYKFQLEDNNPLYYYNGTKLIDWASYQASEAAPSYTAGDGISISNGVISCTPRPYKKEVFTAVSFNASSAYQKGWQNFVASSNLEVGTYKVTLQVHLYIVSNTDNMMPAGCVVNAYMRSKATASSSYQYILGATETFSGGVLPETGIPTGRGIISKVLNVVGFLEVTGYEDSYCSLEVGFTTNSSLNVMIGNTPPLDGSYAGLCSGNDFVLLEKIA